MKKRLLACLLTLVMLLAHKIAKYFGSSIDEIFLFEEEET